MARKNNKKSLINYENCIKKSNEISMAKLNSGLTLNQMQLLAFAIYCTQQNGVTEFHKFEFEKKFNIEKYQTIHAKDDSERLVGLKVSTQDLANDKFKFWNVFMGMEYESGSFKFEWNPNMIPHILELKEKYIVTDLTITSQFKSSYSWMLYDFLKAHYGYWHKPIKKNALLKLFGVENTKTYVLNTGRFKQTVLDVAIKEINEYTELQVDYKEVKAGRTITDFDLYWSHGDTQASATKKQITELKMIVDAVSSDSLKCMVVLSNRENRERVQEILEDIEGYKECTKEPICITKERADFLLIKSNAMLNELERLKENDDKVIPVYDWLNER